MTKTLFTLDVPSTKGSIVCTIPNPDTHKATYLLTWTSGPDNRLTTEFIDLFILALDIIQTKYPHGVVITTSGIPKFYSNGLDLKAATEEPNFFRDKLGKLMRRLLAYPMPTIALINGHAFAGGFIISMCHDYRVQNPAKGFLCMNEIEFGAPLDQHLTSIFRAKLASPRIYQSVILESHRFPGPESLKEGIVDALGGLGEAFGIIDKHNLQKRASSGVWGVLRREMWRNPYTWVKNDAGFAENVHLLQEGNEIDSNDADAAEKSVKQWEAKAKL